jgi:ubiquinone/menaquinone biosynthesis C-methylase UbiE
MRRVSAATNAFYEGVFGLRSAAVGSAVPPRVLWAVERLSVEPDDRLLEIGCGGGVAVSLICDRLGSGTVTAIDRSPVMVERAMKRNEQNVASGKATIQLGELEHLELPDRSFTKIFAVNVNLFWVRSPAPELEIARRLLRPGGALFLFYDAPSESKVRTIAERLVTTLSGVGLPGASVVIGRAGSSPIVEVVARP